MPTTPTSKWTDRRRRAQEEAEALSRRFSRSLPTNLGAMARAQNVREIDFTPLIVDGGLSLLDNGFLISVRCEETEIDHYRHSFQNDPTGKELSPRARFTIAHEIAHTFFFDRDSSPPKSLINYEDRRILPSLEDACSRAARQLLIPEFILQENFVSSEFVQPQKLRVLATEAFVSAPGVVVRFASARVPMPYAILATVERSTSGFQVGTVVRHPGFRDVFLNLEHGTSTDLIVADEDFVLNGGTKLTSTVEHEVSGKTRRYFIATENPAAVTGSCFLTITRDGD